MDIHNTALHVTRRMNLLSLLRDYSHNHLNTTGEASGAEASFASQVGISASMLSQIKKHRPIGVKVARQIEAGLSIDSGWLDVERPLEPAFTPQQLKFERLAQRLWREGTAKQKRAAITALIEILG